MQLQCNNAKLSEPASINGLHIHRALASQIKYTLDENIGGHIYTVTAMLYTIQCTEQYNKLN